MLPIIFFAVGCAGFVGVIVSLVPVVVVEVVAASLLDESVLNPLSPFPGISFPFRGSWFLFTFSSSVASELILFKMIRLLESCLASTSTFDCVFVSSFKSSFAL